MHCPSLTLLEYLSDLFCLRLRHALLSNKDKVVQLLLSKGTFPTDSIRIG